jgi:hypothetical protein
MNPAAVFGLVGVRHARSDAEVARQVALIGKSFTFPITTSRIAPVILPIL